MIRHNQQHPAKNPSKYPLATNATQTARIKSVIIIIAFLFFPPPTHLRAELQILMVLYSHQISRLTRRHCPSVRIQSMEAIASIESPNRLIKAATIIFHILFLFKNIFVSIFSFCSMFMPYFPSDSITTFARHISYFL